MRISPLRQPMIDDMTARHFGEKTQKDYIRCVEESSSVHRPGARDGDGGGTQPHLPHGGSAR